ncbi:MAG: hypothetical protein J6Y26_02795 [Lachnospiraceae bacterium]|nr:hypothetical protein [Lachnospiraceae bacterium]
MYKTIGFFIQDILKSIEQTGRLPVRAHDGKDVFMGHFKDKACVCYRGEFFMVLPEAYQIFKPEYELGPDFGALGFTGDSAIRFQGVRSHPSDNKKMLREIMAASETFTEIFTRETADGVKRFDRAYIQDKYAKWMEDISAYYGNMTELVTDGHGAIVLKRVNGDTLAVAMEVRI